MKNSLFKLKSADKSISEDLKSAKTLTTLSQQKNSITAETQFHQTPYLLLKDWLIERFLEGSSKKQNTGSMSISLQRFLDLAEIDTMEDLNSQKRKLCTVEVHL